MNFNVKSVLPHLIAVVVLAILAAAYFAPALSGEKIGTSDGLGWEGMAQEHRTYVEETGERGYWTTSMFGGMPTYVIGYGPRGNYIGQLSKYLQLGSGAPIGLFFAASLCFYILMISLRVRPLLAVVGAIAFAYATFNIILYAEGHVNKVKVVSYLPLIIAAVVIAYQRRRYILGGLMMALGLGLSLYSEHPQMVYYFGLTILIFGLGRFIYDLRKQQLPHFAKASVAMIIGALLAVGSSAGYIMITQEYQTQSVRGESYLVNYGGADPSTAQEGKEGFEWDRAMAWSNGPKDILASFIPMAAGGGRATVSKDSEFGKVLSRFGAQPTRGRFQAPLYHGDMTFTVGPKYFGTIVFMLFVLGLTFMRKPLTWWLVGGTLLIVLISMGKNAAWLNKPLFDLLPLFNKFRAPDSAMALSILFMLPVGIWGLKSFLDLRRSDAVLAQRKLYLAAGVSVGVALLGLTLLPALLDFSNPGDAAAISRMFGGQADQNTIAQFVSALESTRISALRSDALYVLAFAVSGAALLWLLLKEKISENIAIVLLGVLAFLDFHFINQRYHSFDDYQKQREIKGYFDPTPADLQILADSDPHYRVFNSSPANGDPFSDSKTSYHHKSIGGYSAVKLRRYDDLIKHQLRRGNQDVFNMLNTKYYLRRDQQSGQVQAQRNPAALGNAWFVENIQYVDSHNAEMEALNNFDPDSTAIIKRDEFGDQLAGVQLGQGRIELTSYAPHRLTYSSTNNSEGLAVFSEIWYGPELGWKVTIDGEPAELLRANYVLRALRIPAGTHEIKMEFDPETLSRGNTISTVSSLLVILSLLGYIVYWFLNRWRKPNTATPIEAMDKRPATTKSKRPESVVKPHPATPEAANKKRTKKKKKGKK